jgi:flagellar FliL protein
MTDSATITPPRKGRMPLVAGVLAALALGGGGFYATYTGLLAGHGAGADAPHAEPLPDVMFLPIDPFVISLGPGANARHLRFSAQLEVASPHLEETRHVLPRILDVLNSYLRAVGTEQLEDPAAMARLKAQMLRRVQIVVGEGRVNDLLISEFVLN